MLIIGSEWVIHSALFGYPRFLDPYRWSMLICYVALVLISSSLCLLLGLDGWYWNRRWFEGYGYRPSLQAHGCNIIFKQCYISFIVSFNYISVFNCCFIHQMRSFAINSYAGLSGSFTLSSLGFTIFSGPPIRGPGN